MRGLGTRSIDPLLLAQTFCAGRMAQSQALKDPSPNTHYCLISAGRMAQAQALKDPSHANNQSLTLALKVAPQRRRWSCAQTTPKTSEVSIVQARMCRSRALSTVRC